MAALTRLCGGDTERAAATLGLGNRQWDEVAGNAGLPTAPAAPARLVYSGVLYEALGLSELSPAVRDVAHQRLLIFSGLWGVVRPDDRIPAYRCAVGVKLPNFSGEKPKALGSFWRPHLSAWLPDLLGDEFVLDLRSGAYASMWRPQGGFAAVRILHERIVDGELIRSVVSHFNKATKGRLVADLLAGGIDCDTSDQLTEALRDLKYRVEPSSDATRLDVIVTQL
ncbi:MAG: YaaA family protein [Stackebrandtia sp.]